VREFGRAPGVESFALGAAGVRRAGFACDFDAARDEGLSEETGGAHGGPLHGESDAEPRAAGRELAHTRTSFAERARVMPSVGRAPRSTVRASFVTPASSKGGVSFTSTGSPAFDAGVTPTLNSLPSTVRALGSAP
jgi:hypothetical protein